MIGDVFNQSLSRKLFPALIVGVLICGGGVWVGAPIIAEDNIKADVRAHAAMMAQQFKVIRGYYTQNVIGKVVRSGALTPTSTHKDALDEIPLPATFIHDLSELLSETGTTLKLYSPYPFPVREKRRLDAFGALAWEALAKNPDKPFVRNTKIKGRDVVRVAVADVMVNQVCVDCHNSHPDTPKVGWKLSDLRGVLEISADVTEVLDAAVWTGRSIAVAVMVVLGTVLLLTFVRLRGVVIGPINAMTSVMGSLAAGDLAVDIPGQGRADEIGAMSRAVQVFKDNAIELKRTQEELSGTNNKLSKMNASLEIRAREIKDQARELEETLQREQEVNRQQREFVAMASHEFRTPLAIIDGTAQRIERRKNKLTQDDLTTRVNKIRNAVLRMTGLIDSVLEISKLDAGKFMMERRSLDLAALVSEVCGRQQGISKNHEIVTDLTGVENTVWGDPKLLDQVFTNLLSNAVKYSPNSARIEVTGRYTRHDSVIISVRDHGVGVPQEEVPRLFERYFRASTSVGIAGTGIGLNLVKELVEMHDGVVEMESSEGGGSTFSVHLPIEKAYTRDLRVKAPDGEALHETLIAC